MKKTKSLEPNTLNLKKATFRGDLRLDYDLVYAFKQKPVSDAYLEDIARKMIIWAEDDKTHALVFERFLKENRISWDCFKRWKERSPILDSAHKYALMCIGVRREEGGLTRKLDTSIVMRAMPRYSEEWAKLNEWYAKIKEAPEEKGNVFNIVVPAIPKPEEQK